VREQGLETLTVWQKAMIFSVWVCKDLIPTLPKDEIYALTSQLRRSVQSISANIAEGYGRYYYQEDIRFCYIARGSLEETRSHITFARDMGYLAEPICLRAYSEMEELRRLLNGYIQYLKSQKPGANEPGATIKEESLNYFVDHQDNNQ